MPTQNAGFQAAAFQSAGVALKLLEMAAQKAGATSELGQVLYKMIPQLAKLIPPGAVTPAGEKNEIQNLMMRNAQQGSQVQQARQGAMAPQQGGGQQPGAPPQAAAA